VSQQALVDTHCHLDFNVFNIDRTDVIDRAREAGVERMINPGIDLPTSRTAMELASQYPEVYAAVGVHPNEADSLDFLRSGFLSDCLKHDKVVAVGEIGLDFYRQRTPHDLQVKAFEGQWNYLQSRFTGDRA
jgi:TatD DNase family protein